jgi:alkylated DNA repair dioxygenase AlkB
MRFGYQNLPNWAIKLSNSIHRSCSSSSSVFPSNLLQRKPFFDQMITNFYQPGEGICPHVDLLRFEDGIAIVSLESSCVMDFSLESEETVPVLLNPGSLVFMFGDARYVWKHEINRKPGFQSWQGQLLNQTTRTSVTLRKLCSSPSS